jgi:hypothetical protein
LRLTCVLKLSAAAACRQPTESARTAAARSMLTAVLTRLARASHHSAEVNSETRLRQCVACEPAGIASDADSSPPFPIP